jgi:hypothetical protein
MSDSTLFYVHDPMCSWCWGHRPQWEYLQAALPESVLVKNVVGGLAPDSDKVMPLAQQQAIGGYWKKLKECLVLNLITIFGSKMYLVDQLIPLVDLSLLHDGRMQKTK